MKTTTTKSVDSWLATKAAKENIENLSNALGTGSGKGITWKDKTIFYSKAEVHIYMPRDNITDALKSEWLNKLNKYNSSISYSINALEDYIK